MTRSCFRRCRKNARSSPEAVLKDCRSRKTNLAIAWIDYKKACDMVSHTWIMKCLDMVVVADAVKRILGESIKTPKFPRNCSIFSTC